MIPEIAQKRADIAHLCRQYGVRRLDLFGSAATGTFAPATSDLDFVAQFGNTRAGDYADRYLDFAEALERLFSRPVDVITENAIRNPYFRAEVERTRESVYAEHHEEAPV